MNAPAKPSDKPRILLVEDDDGLARMVTRMLGTFADVTHARDGADALGKLKAGPAPDLVLTDVMMPQMDGFALTKQMKADPQLKGIPIVMLTAKDGPKDVVAGINAGVRGYVTKPFKQEELLAKVKKYLKR